MHSFGCFLMFLLDLGCFGMLSQCCRRHPTIHPPRARIVYSQNHFKNIFERRSKHIYMIFECFWMLLDIFLKILGLVYLVSLGFLYQKRGLHVWEEWCRGALHQRRAEGTGPSIAFRLAFHIQNEDQRRLVAYESGSGARYSASCSMRP